MTWKRTLRIIHWALPLALAAAVAVIGLTAGHTGTPLMLAMVAGALLGWSLAFTLGSVLTMAGVVQVSSAVSAGRLQQMERDKLMLLRSIKEIEFDASMQRLGPEEAGALSEPLRTRAMKLLKQLDQARQESPSSVDDQIERELARRLDKKSGGKKC